MNHVIIIENTFNRFLKNIEDIGQAFMIEVRHHKRELVAQALLEKIQAIKEQFSHKDNQFEKMLIGYKCMVRNAQDIQECYDRIEQILKENTQIYEKFYKETFEGE